MIQLQELDQAFARNVRIIKQQCDGLSHADSLTQPPVRGNCLNWVIGHILSSRDELFEVLDEAPELGDAGARYNFETEPILEDGEGVLPLETLLTHLDRSQERLSAILDEMDEADFTRTVQLYGNETTLGSAVFFRYFHEVYHAGQTELLRQLAGTDDKVI